MGSQYDAGNVARDLLRKPLHSGVSLVALALGASLLQPASARAQGESSVGVIEEVVVTAQRREENVQKVPIAITVLSSDAIEKKSVATFHDLNRVAPGLSVNNAGSDRNSVNFVMRSGRGEQQRQ